jgi:hypothetical protein
LEPIVKLRNLLGGFSLWLKFLRRQPNGERMAESSTLLDRDRRHGEPMHCHGGSGICQKACGAWRDSVEDNEGWFARQLGDLGRRTDRS